MASVLRPYADSDRSGVVGLSLRAWSPVFASFAQVLGDDIYTRLYPDWRAHQAGAVLEALNRNDPWVTVEDDTVSGFVNLIFDADEAAGQIYMVAVDPAFQRQGIAMELTDLAVAEMTRRGLDLATVATGGDPAHAAARPTPSWST